VEARSNTSSIALRVVGGDEKETCCLGVQLDYSVSGGFKYGNLALQAGGLESWILKFGHESRRTDLSMTALTRTSSNCKRQTHVRDAVT
jgi:hypothetical protein